MNATSAPREIRPAATALPPAQSTISVPTPVTSPMSGVKCACVRARSALASRRAALAAANSAVVRASIV